MPTAVLLEIPCLYLIVSEIAFIRCSFRCCERCWAQYLSLIEKVVAGEERMEQRRHAHDVSLRASDSCLPKGGAAQLSFVPSPDGIVAATKMYCRVQVLLQVQTCCHYLAYSIKAALQPSHLPSAENFL